MFYKLNVLDLGCDYMEANQPGYLRAIPFNIHTPPTDEVGKMLTPKKKRSKCRHKTPLRNLKIFPLPLRNIAEIKGCRQD